MTSMVSKYIRRSNQEYELTRLVYGLAAELEVDQ